MKYSGKREILWRYSIQSLKTADLVLLSLFIRDDVYIRRAENYGFGSVYSFTDVVNNSLCCALVCQTYKSVKLSKLVIRLCKTRIFLNYLYVPVFLSFFLFSFLSFFLSFFLFILPIRTLYALVNILRGLWFKAPYQ